MKDKRRQDTYQAVPTLSGAITLTLTLVPFIILIAGLAVIIGNN